MRIISGSHKGHIIRPPKNLPIRPTTDLSKESLFNILVNNFDLEECSVLDLFSGGGSISLEFCSRGAKELTSVDRHPGCTGFLRSEAKKLDFDMIEVVKADVMQFLRNAPGPYDIIFCDPPYAWKQYEEMIRIILDRELLTPEGWCIVEHHSVTSLDHIPERFDKRAYGQNIMSFFRLPEKENSSLEQ
jgi:16S rRNA (guanine(966)-N(2))-methyltransferase RsmD